MINLLILENLKEKLVNLIWYVAFDNLLTGAFPNYFSRMPNLGDIYIGRNFLHGTISPDIGIILSITILTVWAEA